MWITKHEESNTNCLFMHCWLQFLSFHFFPLLLRVASFLSLLYMLKKNDKAIKYYASKGGKFDAENFQQHTFAFIAQPIGWNNSQTNTCEMKNHLCTFYPTASCHATILRLRAIACLLSLGF